MIETNPETTHERIGEQSIVHRREFAASSAQVQRAHTDAEIFSRWMGPRGSRMRIQHFDARTGGSFDYTVEMDGDWRFWGSYHEVADGRIVHSWEFEAEPGHPTFETLEFRDLADGSCALKVTSIYTSKADCDAMAKSGLDGGMEENFDRLDDVLAGLAL